MHPLYSLLATEVHQAELLQEAERARRYGRPRRPRRRRVRVTVGHWLVDLGLRLAVREPARRPVEAVR
jgi:hypothetical protein